MDMDAQIYPEDNKKPSLTVIDGGLARPKPDWMGPQGPDWLLTIKQNQMFLCAPMATNQIGLMVYQLVGFSPEKKAAYLFAQGEHMWVDVNRFSSSHKLIEVFPYEQSNRPDNPE